MKPTPAPSKRYAKYHWSKIKPRLGCEKCCLAAATVAAYLHKHAHTPTTIKVLKTEYGRAEKHFVDVTINKRGYWADLMTGTLYTRDGTCLSTSRMAIVEDDGSDDILRLTEPEDLLTTTERTA